MIYFVLSVVLGIVVFFATRLYLIKASDFLVKADRFALLVMLFVLPVVVAWLAVSALLWDSAQRAFLGGF